MQLPTEIKWSMEYMRNILITSKALENLKTAGP